MDFADYQHLLFERRGTSVLLITINRPRSSTPPTNSSIASCQSVGDGRPPTTR